MKKLLLIFICSLAITACELNDKVEREEQDYYDSVQQKWVGPHADRLNGIDLSPVE